MGCLQMLKKWMTAWKMTCKSCVSYWGLLKTPSTTQGQTGMMPLILSLGMSCSGYSPTWIGPCPLGQTTLYYRYKLMQPSCGLQRTALPSASLWEMHSINRLH